MTALMDNQVPPAARARARELCAALTEHDRLYYLANQPAISDFEYDHLYRELADLEQKYPVLRAPDSPTARVGGAPLTEFQPVRHRQPMLSLSNTYSRAELHEFYARTTKLLPDIEFTLVLEPKIDGVAVTVRYENGLLAAGASRGNGLVGDDITANLRVIRAVPLRLRIDLPPAVLEVRGEVFMPRQGFEALNRARAESGEPLFANPRNAAAGSLKLLDPRAVAARPLAAIFYGGGEVTGVSLPQHTDLLAYLEKAGLPVPPRWWRCVGMPELLAALDEMQSVREAFPFDTDGAVIKINQRALYDRLGVTAKSPRWAVAFKFAPERAVTRLRDITVQVGRTGVLTPVAELEPVSLAGSTIERATLHNADEIARRDIRIGDLVTIEKAGDVIPAVTGVDVAARTGVEKAFAMPACCPVCGGVAGRRPDEIAWRCENLQCPAQVKRWLMHFAARNAMDIENLGESVVDQLVSRDMVRNPADLYSLTADMLARLERMGKKSTDNLLAGIALSKHRSLCNLIFGLGIRHVGAGLAGALERHFDDLDALTRATPEQLTAIRDVGPAAATALVDYFTAPRTAHLLQRLRAAGVNMRRLAGAAVADPDFAGHIFVLTGALARLPRAQAETEIRRRGGTVSASVSAKTGFVVAGAEAGTKLEKALKLGVPVLTEDEFIARLAVARVPESAAADVKAAAAAPLARPGELFLL